MKTEDLFWEAPQAWSIFPGDSQSWLASSRDLEIIGEVYKQLWVAPSRGTGLHKLTNKRDYSRESTRDDSLVLRDSLVPSSPTFPPFSARCIHFEFLSSCNMHPTILKSESMVYHLLLQSTSLCMLQSHEWWVRKRKLAWYDHCVQKSNVAH